MARELSAGPMVDPGDKKTGDRGRPRNDGRSGHSPGGPPAALPAANPGRQSNLEQDPGADHNVDLTVDLGGVTLASPVVLLSGCVGFGADLLNLAGFDFTSVGAICLKGTTLHPRQGNQPHRLAETPAGMLNAIGLQNPGARAVVDEILPSLTARLAERSDARHLQLIANIAGASVEEYAEVARLFDDSPVAAIEINISCPNVKEGGVAFGSDPAMAARVVQAVRRATSKPLIAKLSPNVTSIRAVARAILDVGIDAFAVINTLMGMAVDIQTRRPVLGNVTGGLSGPAIRPAALLKVWETYQECGPDGPPIIGQGGIASAEDAAAFFIVGAAAVGVGTALFNNPLMTTDLTRGLAGYLGGHGMRRLSELTGSLEIPVARPG